MERASRLRSLWSWLPAFRAVAETAHLPTASAALHVSASSLSRTIRLLEEDVGQPLFDRVGRGLVLNDAGRVLLDGVRLAMRSVDEALVRVGPGKMAGRVTLHAEGPLAALYLLPALRALGDAHPELVPVIVRLPEERVAEALRMGDVDVALTDAPSVADDLTVVPLAPLPHALFCAPGHPLAGCGRPTAEAILAHPFVAPPSVADAGPPDPWPAARRRRVGLLVADMQGRVDACASGAYLAVLPSPVGERAGLTRLAVAGVGRTELHLVHRPSLAVAGRTELVVRAIAAEVVG